MFFIIIIGGVTTSQAYGQVDPLIEIGFLQSGVMYYLENQFNISDNVNISKFFNGSIIHVSGQTVKGFPHITYSKITDENKQQIFSSTGFTSIKDYLKQNI